MFVIFFLSVKKKIKNIILWTVVKSFKKGDQDLFEI